MFNIWELKKTKLMAYELIYWTNVIGNIEKYIKLLNLS